MPWEAGLAAGFESGVSRRGKPMKLSAARRAVFEGAVVAAQAARAMSLRLRALFVVHAGTIPSSDEDEDEDGDDDGESVGEDASAASSGQEAGKGSNDVDDSGSHSLRNSDAGMHGPGSPAISRHSPASSEGTTTRKSGGGGSDGSGAGETTALAPARQVSGRRAQARARNPPNVVDVTPLEARSMVCAAAARRVIELCSGALGIKVPPVVLAGSYRQMHRCAVPWPWLRRMAWAQPVCC